MMYYEYPSYDIEKVYKLAAYMDSMLTETSTWAYL